MSQHAMTKGLIRVAVRDKRNGNMSNVNVPLHTLIFVELLWFRGTAFAALQMMRTILEEISGFVES